MNSKRAPIIGLIICLLAAAGLIWLIFTKNGVQSVSNNELILFYGETCPHCKNVEQFIRINGIDLKLDITRREAFLNRDNGNLLIKTAAQCGFSTNQIGVPLLWDGKNCYSGEDEIINFLIQAADIQ